MTIVTDAKVAYEVGQARFQTSGPGTADPANRRYAEDSVRHQIPKSSRHPLLRVTELEKLITLAKP
jgi:hypothetical protein